jgi:hypothetical protein
VEPQDVLAQRIVAYVRTNVQGDHVEVVARTVCMVVATLMADPSFLNELQVIKDLRERVAWLHNENLILKDALTQTGVRRPAKKKAAPRKAAAPRVRGGTAQQRAAFRQGYGA